MPYDVAAGSGGQVFVSGGGSGWTDVIVVDTEAGIVQARWGGVWARSLIALTPDRSRLITSKQGVTPGRMEALPLPEPITDKPQAYAAPADAKVGGPFVVTPDGRFVLCQTGTVLRLAGTRVETCSRSPTSARSWPRPSTPTAARRTSSARTALEVFSYPEFKSRTGHRTGMAAYGAALDAKAGRLYVAGIPLAGLRDRPRDKAIGDIMVFDVRDLTAT